MENFRRLNLDLSKAAAMLSGKQVLLYIHFISELQSATFSFAQEKQMVSLYCQAWAKNIDTERIYVDKVTKKS